MLGKFESTIGGVGRALVSLQGIVGTLATVYIGGKLVGALSSVVGAGAELNAVLSKNKVIFGDSADVIVKKSDELAEGAGIVKTEFINAAASFGAVFKGMGRTQAEAAQLGIKLSMLGIDMASFEGVGATTAEVFTALQAALRGEFDPIERFRVFLSAAKIEAKALSMGLASNKKEITDLAKKTATLALIFEQTKDAQGDLTRTLMDADNQMKGLGGRWENLKQEMGLALQPATEAVLRLAGVAMKQLTDAFGENKDAVRGWAQDAQGGVGLVLTAFDRLGEGAAGIADAIQDIRLRFKGLGVIGVESAAIITNAYVMATDSINALVTKLTGKEFARMADAPFVRAMNDEARKAFAEFKAMEGAPKPGAAIRAGFAKVKAGAAPKAPASLMQQIGDALPGLLGGLFGKLAGPGVPAAAGAVAKKKDVEEPKFAAALLAGSAEARSAVLRHQGMTKADEPIKQVAKQGEKQVELQLRIAKAVEIMATGKTGLVDAFAGMLGAG